MYVFYHCFHTFTSPSVYIPWQPHPHLTTTEPHTCPPSSPPRPQSSGARKESEVSCQLYDQCPGCFMAQPVWTRLPHIYRSAWVFLSVWVYMSVCHCGDEPLISLIHRRQVQPHVCNYLLSKLKVWFSLSLSPLVKIKSRVFIFVSPLCKTDALSNMWSHGTVC